MGPIYWNHKILRRLSRLKRAIQRRLEGFTLIEMILVATLIIILSTLAVASMRVARNKGFETGAATGLKALASAQEMFLVDNGRYAGGFSVLATTYLPDPYPPVGGISIFIKQYSVIWWHAGIDWAPAPSYPGSDLVNVYSLNRYTIFALPIRNDLKTFAITDSGAVQVLKPGPRFDPY
jgi:type II secretory pathway pseudopilin PulG